MKVGTGGEPSRAHLGNFLTAFDEVTVDELVFEESLAKRNDWLKFYKEETIRSVAARRGFVAPECGEMVGVDWFLERR